MRHGFLFVFMPPPELDMDKPRILDLGMQRTREQISLFKPKTEASSEGSWQEVLLQSRYWQASLEQVPLWKSAT